MLQSGSDFRLACVECGSAVFYVVAQSLGAIIGAGVLKAVSLSGTNDALGTAAPAAGVTQAQTFIIELIISFVLVLTVFATCDSLRSGIGGSGPLAIGLSISMCHLWAVSCIPLYVSVGYDSIHLLCYVIHC